MKKYEKKNLKKKIDNTGLGEMKWDERLWVY